jgi:hypothetical protein
MSDRTPAEFDRAGYIKKSDCAQGVVAITEDVELEFTSRGIYVGSPGDLEVVLADGSQAIFVGVLAGCIYPLSVQMVVSTGTTAGSLLATY